MATIEKLYPDVRDFLTRDPAHALSARALSVRTGLDSREITRSIERSRRAGVPICSNGSGFWITDDPAELLVCADDLSRRIRTQRQTERALRRTARRMQAEEKAGMRFSQLNLDDDPDRR